MSNYYANRLAELAGATIVGAALSPKDEFGDEFFGLELVTSEGKKLVLWILRDDEGNGPGSFELEEL